MRLETLRAIALGVQVFSAIVFFAGIIVKAVIACVGWGLLAITWNWIYRGAKEDHHGTKRRKR